MTQDEAANIIVYLNAAFPNEALEGESVVVYARHIADLHDYVIARLAADVHAKDGQRMPTIKEFRETYRTLGGIYRQAETCIYCDKGQVVVQTRPAGPAIVRPHGQLETRQPPEGAAYEEMGPCPFCELGQAFENSVWPDGFWQGREPEIITPPTSSVAARTPDEWEALGIQHREIRARDYGETPDVPSDTPLPRTEVEFGLEWSRFLSARYGAGGIASILKDFPVEDVPANSTSTVKRGMGITQPTMKEAPAGHCEDCGEKFDRRWAYGKVTICDGCLLKRQRIARQLG